MKNLLVKGGSGVGQPFLNRCRPHRPLDAINRIPTICYDNFEKVLLNLTTPLSLNAEALWPLR